MFDATINDLFIVEYKNDNEIVPYSIDTEKEGYLKINKNQPLAKHIIENNPDPGDIFTIGDDKYPIQLICKSYNLFKREELDEEIEIIKYRKILINKLKEYNELGFLHTTDLNNLKSIYQEGFIYSRNIIKEKNIKIEDIANHEILEISDKFVFDYVRFYLRRNTPANYMMKGNNCILVCDYDIINSSNKMYITEKIITSSPYKNNLNNIKNLKYLTTYFHYNDIYNEEYTDEKLKKDYKGAEFLCINNVPIKYLKTIILKNNQEKEWFIKEFPNWEIEIKVDRNYFKKSEGCGNYD